MPGYEASVVSYRQERIFMDTSQPLVRPRATPTLADLQATKASQWWSGTKLYVRLGLWSGSLTSTDPRQHTIEIPTYKGILVGSGSVYVTIRGLNIRHTNMAIGFTGDATIAGAVGQHAAGTSEPPRRRRYNESRVGTWSGSGPDAGAGACGSEGARS